MPLEDGEEEEIRELLDQNRKIDAIKLYRDLTGAGLADAKRAVEAIQLGQFNQPLHDPALNPETGQQIQELLAAGEKIEAIKLYRQATGAGLKEAKDFVEGKALPPGRRVALDPQAEEQIRSSLEQNRRMEALRLYIEATGATIPEAQEALDALARKHALEPSPRAGCLGVLLVIAALLGAFLIERTLT